MVVSFMIVIPFSLGFVVVRFDRTAAPIASVAAEPIAGHVQHLPAYHDRVCRRRQLFGRHGLVDVVVSSVKSSSFWGRAMNPSRVTSANRISFRISPPDSPGLGAS
jgi:hypothetical protein